ncbi:MAG TPA: hypothetical protein VEA58_05420 [Anaerovoracaceae bacterium]|nr:hypothetical protein [Anaerovoracaceae bacterium]
MNSKGQWMTREFIEQSQRISEKASKSMIFMDWEIHKKRAESNVDNRKCAYIIIGNTRVPAFVDTITREAYKSENYKATWMNIPRFKFDRWMTTFDL